MKNLKYLTIIITLLLVTISYSQTTWKIDPTHSKIGFGVTHLLISEVEGKFLKYDGTITTKGDDLTSLKIDLTIDVNSISTENEKRDQHLKSDDFFNAEKYPTIKFVSKSFKKISNNKYKLIGDLTIRDVTKKVEFNVIYGGTIKDGWSNVRAGFKLTGSINRFDYNLKWNNLIETGGAVVGKDVRIDCVVEVIKSTN